MHYTILYDEEINLVEIRYEGVNAALLAAMQVQLNQLMADLDTLELSFQTYSGTVNLNLTSLNNLVAAQGSALNDEITLRSTGDTTLGTSFGNSLTALDLELTTAIENEATIRAAAIIGEANARNAAIASSTGAIITDVAVLTSSVSGMSTQLGAAQTDIITVTTGLSTETSARSAQYSALLADYGTTNAAVLAETVARANADSALAVDVTALYAEIDDVYAAVVAEASARVTSDGVIEAKYSVKVDANGKVAGFGLISTANNATPTSEFSVNADAFNVYNGTSDVPVFSVSGGNVVLQNLTVNGNLLVTGTIVASKFQTDAGVDLAAIVPGGLNTQASFYDGTERFLGSSGTSITSSSSSDIPSRGQRVYASISVLIKSPSDGTPLDTFGLQAYLEVSYNAGGSWSSLGNLSDFTGSNLSYVTYSKAETYVGTLATSGDVRFRITYYNIYVGDTGYSGYFVDELNVNIFMAFVK